MRGAITPWTSVMSLAELRSQTKFSYRANKLDRQIDYLATLSSDEMDALMKEAMHGGISIVAI